MRKSQISMEYLIIVGIALAIIIPGAIIVTDYSRRSNDELVSEQINTIGVKILSNAEQIYLRGGRITLEISVPEAFESAQVLGGSELVIEYRVQNGIREAVFFSDVKLSTDSCLEGVCTVDLHAGVNNLRIESEGSSVLLAVVS